MDAKDFVRKPILRKTALWSLGILVGIGVLGFLAAPPLVKYFAQQKLSEMLHRPVTIEGIRINPYTLSASVRGFEMKERDGAGTAVKFDELAVNLQAESLVRGGFVLQEIRLANPYVHVVRNEDGTYNFTDLVEEILKQPPSEEPSRFSLNNIQLSGGRIDFDDRPLKARHAVTDMTLGVPFLSNLPSHVDIEVQPAFSAIIDGSRFAVGGEAKPFTETREASIDVHFGDFDLTRYVDYSPLPLPFKVPSGKLDSKLAVHFLQPQQGAPNLTVRGDLALKQLAITERGGAPVLDLPLLAVSLKSVDVFGRSAGVNSVAVQGPHLRLKRGKDGNLTLLSLLPQAPAAPQASEVAQPPAAKQPAAPFRFTVAEVKLSDGRIGFADEAVAPTFQSNVEALNLTVKNLGNAADQTANVEASLKTGAGEEIRHSGTLVISPLAAKGKVEVTGVKLPHYAPYYSSAVVAKLVSGSVDLATNFDVALDEKGPRVLLDALAVKLQDLALRHANEKEDFYRLAEANVTGGKVDLGARNVTIDEVVTRDAKLRVTRDKDGTLSVNRIFPVTAAAAGAAKAEEPWAVAIGKVTTQGYDILFEDRALPAPARLSLTGIQTTVENLSNQKGAQSKLTFDAKVNKRGSMKLSGVAGLDPRKAQLAVDLKGIEILPFQPYFADKVNITLTGGAVAARGNLAVEVPAEGAIRASYRGNAGIANLHTIDKANAADFLVWKSLFFDGISLSRLQPLKLDIKEVALSDFYSRLILSAEGKLNVQQIMSKPEAEAAAAEAQRDAAAPVPPAAAEPSPPAVTAGAAESKPAAAPGVTPLPPPPDYKITVQKLTLQGGNVNFSDFFIKPNYTADMKELGGRVTGLSSDLGTTADVELRGQVSDAPLEILGKVNPLTGNLFLDLKASVKGMELPQFTPYSSKYAGYAIEKGKLTVNIGYKIENRKLEAQNNVYLDQLTFGEKIESPDATKLPVLLAVSLLKDRNGVIDINLPIGGSLDDPKFSVGGIIIQVIVNLIVKAVTAPFALIGSLFGGGEELAYAEFDYGSTVITEPTQKKLETLAKALTERPGLKLEIAGRVDPANDTEGLKKAAVERKVKAQKLADQVKKGEAAESVDSVTVDKDEYPKYLERAYKQEKFPKPRNVIGMAKDLPPEEMEKLMLTHAQAGDEDLRTLALQRAQTVKDHLIHKGKVPEERVFTVAPKLTADDAKDKDKAKLSRVDFSLK